MRFDTYHSDKATLGSTAGGADVASAPVVVVVVVSGLVGDCGDVDMMITSRSTVPRWYCGNCPPTRIGFGQS